MNCCALFFFFLTSYCTLWRVINSICMVTVIYENYHSLLHAMISGTAAVLFLLSSRCGASTYWSIQNELVRIYWLI